MNISELKVAEYNPRLQLTPDMPGFERLKQSILEFGNVEPIVFNKHTGHVVGGHQRLAVLKELGETETDVSVIDMPIEQEKLLNVALNKIKGDWDYNKLPELLKEFDINEVKLSGFSPAELAVLCADVNATVEAVEDDDINDRPEAEEEYEIPREAQHTSNLRETDFIPKRPEDNMINTTSAPVSVPAYSPAAEVETYVVSLFFDTPADAFNWMLERGWGEQYKQGTHSTVLRIE